MSMCVSGGDSVEMPGAVIGAAIAGGSPAKDTQRTAIAQIVIGAFACKAPLSARYWATGKQIFDTARGLRLAFIQMQNNRHHGHHHHHGISMSADCHGLM